jgi:multimeric flavodoxin WrbA
MKVIIVSGTPKKEGLSCSCVNAARTGAEKAGAECEVVSLCDYEIARCAICGDGWGTCRENHRCAFGDDGFTEIQDKLMEADAVILTTPVYWGYDRSNESVFRSFSPMRSFPGRKRCDCR